MTILAEGQLAITPSTIFEAGGADVFQGASFTIDKITFFNEGTGQQTSILSIQKFSEVQRVVRQFKLKQNEGGEYLEPGEVLTLENGDKLLAKTSTIDSVNFTVIGERT